MTDLYSTEVPVIEVDNSIGEARGCHIVDRLIAGRPSQKTVMENGMEFSGMVLVA